MTLRLPSRKWLVAILALVAACAAGGAAWRFWPVKPPDPAKQTPQEIIRYMASEEFAKLPAERRRQYFDQSRQTAAGDMGLMRQASSSDLSPDQRNRLR